MNNNEKHNNEFKKHTIKVAVTSVISTLLFVAFLLLFVLFSLKNCDKENNAFITSYNSSLSMKYNYDSEQLDKRFKSIVNQELSFEGFEDEVTDIVAVTYIDNYPNSFSLDISSTCGNTLYFYQLEVYAYTGDKASYDNFVAYLLSLITNDRLEGDCTLERLEVVDEPITTSKNSYKCVIGKSQTNAKYVFGYYYENNQYYIYQNKEMNGDPFSGQPSLTIDTDGLLYSYYKKISHDIFL